MDQAVGDDRRTWWKEGICWNPFKRLNSATNDIRENHQDSTRQDTIEKKICPLFPLKSDPEITVQAWRDEQEGRGEVETYEICKCCPKNCPKWWKTINKHFQCMTPGAGTFLCNLCGKVCCMTVCLPFTCSRMAIEENCHQNRNKQEIVHSWKTDQAYELKNLTINLGDMRNQE